MRTTLILLLLLVQAYAGDDVKELAKKVKDYRTKFELIAIGRPAVPALMAQLDAKDKWLVFESKSALRWIASHAKDRTALAEDLAVFTSGMVTMPG